MWAVMLAGGSLLLLLSPRAREMKKWLMQKNLSTNDLTLDIPSITHKSVARAVVLVAVGRRNFTVRPEFLQASSGRHSSH